MDALALAVLRAKTCPPSKNSNGHREPSKSREIEEILARLDAAEARLEAFHKSLADIWGIHRQCLDCGKEFVANTIGITPRCLKCAENHKRAKKAAYVAYNIALKAGTLVRQPCEICGNPQADGHHEDYEKPLNVRWLCRSHHGKAHAVVDNYQHGTDNCTQGTEPTPPPVSDEEPPLKRRPSIREIQEIVGQKYGFSHNDMISERRTMRLAWARQVAMYLCTRLTLKSLPAIGKHFGFRDHTTVLHARNKVTEIRAADEDVRNALIALEAALA